MSTVLVAPDVKPMSPAEARACVQRIRDGIESIRHCLRELHRRKGWKALGYANLRECARGEFGREKSQLYHELQAAEVEENLSEVLENSTIVENAAGWLPDGHARVLADLLPEQQREIYQAVKAAKGEDFTAKDLQEAKVELLFSMLSPDKQKEIIEAEERDALAKAEQKPTATTGTFMKAQSYLGKMLTAAQKFGSTVEKFESPDPVILEEIRAGLAHFQKARELLPTLDPEG
jgi:hypothetical protein